MSMSSHLSELRRKHQALSQIIEEEQRKLRELEEKKTNTNTTTKVTLPKKTRVKSDLIHFQVPSPVFSLII